MPPNLPKLFGVCSVAAVALGLGFEAKAAFVNAWSSDPVPAMTAIGNVVQGQSYVLTILGQADVDTGNVALINASGQPNYIGWGTQDYPTNNIGGTYGIAGAGFYIGALVGSYSANPSSPSDYFALASSASQKQTFVATQTGTLYANINDLAGSYYYNCGGFNVTLGTVSAAQYNFACGEIARTLTATATATPIATLELGKQYTVSANGTINVGGTSVPTPLGVTPYVNGFKTGQLLLSFTKSPTFTDLIPLGTNGSYTFISTTNGPLYALVNAAGTNNWAAFQTIVVEIPEPMSLSLLLTGLGMVWAARGRGRAKA